MCDAGRSAISLLGNVGLPDELDQIADHHLDGVGLFRTEFLFIDSHKRPGFDLQARVYGDMANTISWIADGNPDIRSWW